jgi:phage FluMu protein Com
MDPLYMTVKVRVKCAVCKTINVAIPDDSVDPAAVREANRIKPR